MKRLFLIAVLLGLSQASASASGGFARHKILIPVTSPSLTAVARDARHLADWTTTASRIATTLEYIPDFSQVTMVKMYVVAPDFSTTATTFTISIQSFPELLPTTTTAVLSENTTTTINMNWPGVPLIGSQRFTYTCTTANTTDVVQLLTVWVETEE